MFFSFEKRDSTCPPAPSCTCAADEQCQMTPPTSTSCAKIQCIKITPTSSPTPTSTNSSAGAIAGGVVGGVVGALLVVGLCVWFFFLRKRKQLRLESYPNLPGEGNTSRDGNTRFTDAFGTVVDNDMHEKSPTNRRGSTATMTTVNTVRGSNIIPIAYIPGVSGVNMNGNKHGLAFSASDILRDDSIRASIATTNYRGSTAFIGSDTITAVQARPNLVDLNSNNQNNGSDQSVTMAEFMRPALLDLTPPNLGNANDNQRLSARPSTDRMTILNTIDEDPKTDNAAEGGSMRKKSNSGSGSGLQVINRTQSNRQSTSSAKSISSTNSGMPNLRVSVSSDFDVAFPMTEDATRHLAQQQQQQNKDQQQQPVDRNGQFDSSDRNSINDDNLRNVSQISPLNKPPMIPVPAVPGASSSNSTGSKPSSRSSSSRLSKQALRNSVRNSMNSTTNRSSNSTNIRDSDYYVAEDLPMEAFLYSQSLNDNDQDDQTNNGRNSPFDDKYEVKEKGEESHH